MVDVAASWAERGHRPARSGVSSPSGSRQWILRRSGSRQLATRHETGKMRRLAEGYLSVAWRVRECNIVANPINRAIELLRQDQAIYYVGGHSGHALTYAQGREDAHVWDDYINVGMEHGSFDMAGLAEYMRGLVDGGPTRSGHRTPTVIVEAPVNGTDADNVRFNAWQFRQILGRGVHGILLCQAEAADAARAFVESCRYPHHSAGMDQKLPTPLERLRGTAMTGPPASGTLGVGTRGRGSEATAASIWGVAPADYMA